MFWMWNNDRAYTRRIYRDLTLYGILGQRGIACVHVRTPLCSFTLLITKVSCGCGLWLATTIKSNLHPFFSPFKLVVCESLSLWLVVGSIFESQPIIYSLDCSVFKVVASSTFSQDLDLEIP